MKLYDVTIKFRLRGCGGDSELTATRTHTVEAQDEREAVAIVSDIENKEILKATVCVRK